MTVEQLLFPLVYFLTALANGSRAIADGFQLGSDAFRALGKLLWRWSQSLPRQFRRWRRGGWRFFRKTPAAPRFRGRSSWNRTPEAIEKRVVELKAEHPHLGVRQLARLVFRLTRFVVNHETVRRILLRRRDLVVTKPRRIKVSKPRSLWGADLTSVSLFGLFPVYLLGVVDYYGSRLVTLERLENSKAPAIAAALERAIQLHGAPKRLLTDRGANLAAPAMQAVFEKYDIEHTRTKPRHPWTNGRIERLFRTFKETVFRYIWAFTDKKQIDRYCADFLQYYNRDRPHSAWGGRTPDEVYFRRRPKGLSAGRVTYFDGHLCWYKFG